MISQKIKATFLRKLKPGINPIIVKELRSRMRGGRAFAILTGVLFLLAAFSYILYRIVLSTLQYASTPASPQIGQALFAGLATLELMMICFITPAITAGSISSEQEKLTYEMLMATPLPPVSILWGKLLSALSYVFLLIFAAIPMASLVFIFGGVALKEMLKALIILSATAVTLGVVGTFMSAWLRRTVVATVLSYLVVLLLLVGPIVVYIFVGVLQQKTPPRWLLIPNPVSALFSAIAPSLSRSGGPVGLLGELGWFLNGMFDIMRGGGIQPVGIPRPLYHYSLPFYGALSLLLYLLSTRVVRTTRRWRLHWKEVLIALVLILAFGGLVALPFVLTANRYERMSLAPIPTPVPVGMPQALPVEPQVDRVVAVQPSTSPLPTPTPDSTLVLHSESEIPDLSAEDRQRAEMYAQVILQRYMDTPQLAIRSSITTIYLLRVIDDGQESSAAPQEIAPEIQQAILYLLQDFSPAQFLWIDGYEQAPIDPQTGLVLEGGAILALNDVHEQKDETVLVSASCYLDGQHVDVQTYRLQQGDVGWQIIETVEAP